MTHEYWSQKTVGTITIPTTTIKDNLHFYAAKNDGVVSGLGLGTFLVSE